MLIATNGLPEISEQRNYYLIVEIYISVSQQS
jgi:hypothetical protein